MKIKLSRRDSGLFITIPYLVNINRCNNCLILYNESNLVTRKEVKVILSRRLYKHRHRNKNVPGLVQEHED